MADCSDVACQHHPQNDRGPKRPQQNAETEFAVCDHAWGQNCGGWDPEADMALGGPRRARSIEDVARAIRSLARHFDTDTIFIVGSQAALIEWPDAPPELRSSPELDVYVSNARSWEAANPGAEASEEINALFGYGSNFHEAFGFYLDGVDETTARLPEGWRDRCRTYEVDLGDGQRVRAIAPDISDLVVSKLHRFDEKDKQWVADWHRNRPLNIELIKKLFRSTIPHSALEAVVIPFLESLAIRDH